MGSLRDGERGPVHVAAPRGRCSRERRRHESREGQGPGEDHRGGPRRGPEATQAGPLNAAHETPRDVQIAPGGTRAGTERRRRRGHRRAREGQGEPGPAACRLRRPPAKETVPGQAPERIGERDPPRGTPRGSRRGRLHETKTRVQLRRPPTPHGPELLGTRRGLPGPRGVPRRTRTGRVRSGQRARSRGDLRSSAR